MLRTGKPADTVFHVTVSVAYLNILSAPDALLAPDALPSILLGRSASCPQCDWACSLDAVLLGLHRYQMAVRLGEIMEELEQQDHAAGDELNPVPSWIRAHFVLEQEFEQINARQQELEAAMSDADNQRMQARSVRRWLGPLEPAHPPWQSPSSHTVGTHLRGFA